MPLGIERINPRRKQPNERINFIKPLEGPDKAFAQDFLERIAAICNPIMKANHLAVMSLEEYECNREFLGRNFNAGEVIQLVLKAPSGHWLPVKMVQMVMMHELAHCKQMNHSGAFWKVKNQYSIELKALWAKRYTGEGMWSRGRTLLTGQYESEGLASDEVLPEHLCGGTFRSSGKRKRKIKAKLSYKEQQERRIANKFGTNGMALGADQELKAELEKGKKVSSKPRVASSNRGRELRAAAALARSERKKDEVKEKDGVETESEIEAESDWEDYLDIKAERGEAIDINGKRLLDSKGRAMIRVSEEKDDVNIQNEMPELRKLEIKQEDSEADYQREPTSAGMKSKRAAPISQRLAKDGVTPADLNQENKEMHVLISPQLENEQKLQLKSHPNPWACPVCSMENDPSAPTCMVCANVLDLKMVPITWRCQSKVCRGGIYVNAGDYGVCGICGGSAPSHT